MATCKRTSRSWLTRSQGVCCGSTGRQAEQSCWRQLSKPFASSSGIPPVGCGSTTGSGTATSTGGARVLSEVSWVHSRTRHSWLKRSPCNLHTQRYMSDVGLQSSRSPIVFGTVQTYSLSTIRTDAGLQLLHVCWTSEQTRPPCCQTVVCVGRKGSATAVASVGGLPVEVSSTKGTSCTCSIQNGQQRKRI